MSNSLISLAAIVQHTPVWVWFVLVLLIWRGLISAQPREVGLVKLLLLPLVLTVLSVHTLLGAGSTNATLAGIGIGALVGIAAGLQLDRHLPAVAIGNQRLYLAGEWTPLLTVLAVFVMRYIKSAAASVDPALAGNATFLIVTGAISACFTLLLLTRTALRLRVLLAQPPLVVPN